MEFKFTLKDLKNYKDGRKNLGIFGMLLISKNNQPKAGVVSVTEYERFRKLIEYLRRLERKDIN